LKEIKQLLFLGKRQHQEKAILVDTLSLPHLNSLVDLDVVGKRKPWQIHPLEYRAKGWICCAASKTYKVLCLPRFTTFFARQGFPLGATLLSTTDEILKL
jgi:hypothetical protein